MGVLAPAVAVSIALLSAVCLGDRQLAVTEQVPMAVRDAQIAPDGTVVVFTRGVITAEANKPSAASVWRVPFAGGEPTRLTAAESDASHPRWSPDGQTIAFLSRAGADGPAHVALIPASGGAQRPISDPLVNVLSFEWSPDGRRIAYTVGEGAAGGPGRLYAIELGVDAAAKTTALGAEGAVRLAWSADSSALAVVLMQPGQLARLVVRPIVGAAREIVTAPAIDDVAWARDGEALAWIAEADGVTPAPPQVMIAAPSGAPGARAQSVLAPGEGTPLHIGWTGGGRLSVVLRQAATTRIDLFDPRGGERVTVMPPGTATIASPPSWSATGARYAVVGSTADHPGEVFAGSLPLPIPPGNDFVGAPPPQVRRLTFTHP